ncbi:hypothetical protein NDU88_001216 [Pleurodeles waltl]|uniref:Uncharacterized protein n=1 Tax=Pleurodeles waltl TaxID=8319 RepID=A0AAV7WL47_PLEWA|nr:hypothetical protein NDU88_001216 [Pleurodeles waltl]
MDALFAAPRVGVTAEISPALLLPVPHALLPVGVFLPGNNRVLGSKHRRGTRLRLFTEYRQQDGDKEKFLAVVEQRASAPQQHSDCSPGAQ